MAAPVPADSQVPPSKPAGILPPARRRRRRILAAMFVVYLLLLLEAGSRLYWTAGRGVPLFRTSRVEMAYFASLRETRLLDRSVSRDDGTYDVLLLGGSVLHRQFGDVAEQVERELSQLTSLPVRVHNLAEPGQTTRDSLLKYRLLEKQRFDLVVVYHGINDARQNNCPRARFRDDYTHCGWYRKLALIERHPERAWLTLPYSIDVAAVSLLEARTFGRYLPRDTPAAGWGADSEDVKTAVPFRRNLEEIAALAESRGDPLALMTFAHQAERYLPFPHLVTGVTAWGTPKGVLAALDAHNAAVRETAASHPSALFVDQAGTIPKTEGYLKDPCHLTHEGCALWAANLARAIRERGGGGSTPDESKPERPLSTAAQKGLAN